MFNYPGPRGSPWHPVERPSVSPKRRAHFRRSGHPEGQAWKALEAALRGGLLRPTDESGVKPDAILGGGGFHPSLQWTPHPLSRECVRAAWPESGEGLPLLVAQVFIFDRLDSDVVVFCRAGTDKISYYVDRDYDYIINSVGETVLYCN